MAACNGAGTSHHRRRIFRWDAVLPRLPDLSRAAVTVKSARQFTAAAVLERLAGRGFAAEVLKRLAREVRGG